MLDPLTISLAITCGVLVIDFIFRLAKAVKDDPSIGLHLSSNCCNSSSSID